MKLFLLIHILILSDDTTIANTSIHWSLTDCEAVGLNLSDKANSKYQLRTNKYSCGELYVGNNQ
jgi:hypothetical protein